MRITRKSRYDLRESNAAPSASLAVGEPASDMYREGRRAWNERYGDEIQSAARWRFFALGCLAVALVAVSYTGYVSSKSRFVPYVVETDKLGDAVAVGPLSPAPIRDERVIDAQLARWIVDVRSVYNDAAAESALLNDSYASVQPGTPAFISLNNFLHLNNPFQAGANKTVTVDVHSVLPISANVYQVKWTEDIDGKNDGTNGAMNWTAIITVTINPPSTYAAIQQNPAGVYITQYSWSQDVN